MADYNVGEAIGLGTRAVPYRGQPITTGVRLLEQNDLRRAAMEAKQAAQEKADRDKMLGLMKYSRPKVIDQFQEEMTKLGEDANLAILSSKNLAEAHTNHGKYMGQIMDVAANSDYIKGVRQQINSGEHITVPAFDEAINAKTAQGRKEAIAKITPLQRSIYGGLYSIDQSNPDNPIPEYHGIKNIDLNNHTQQVIRSLTGFDSPQAVGKLSNDQFQVFLQSVEPAKLAHQAALEVHNDIRLENKLLQQYPKESERIFQQLNASHPDASDQEKREATAVEILHGIYADQAKTWQKYSLRNLNENANLTLGAGSSRAGGNTFTTSVETDSQKNNFVNALRKREPNLTIPQAEARYDAAVSSGAFIPTAETMKTVTTSIKPVTSGKLKEVILTNGLRKEKGIVDKITTKYNENGELIGGTMTLSYKRGSKTKIEEFPLDKTNYAAITGGVNGIDIDEQIRKNTNGEFGLPDDFKTTTSVVGNKGTGKRIPLTTIKSKVGTKGFEGYSEKQLIDYYRNQGYTVE